MGKKGQGAAGGIPYAELIIRPADARPIVVRIEEQGGDVDISPGTVDDTAEAVIVLTLMMMASSHLGNARVLKGLFPAEVQKKLELGDDIPF